MWKNKLNLGVNLLPNKKKRKGNFKMELIQPIALFSPLPWNPASVFTDTTKGM